MNTDMTVWIASAVVGFILFRLLTRKQSVPTISDYETEINDILTNEKYKVKGRFE